MNAKVLRLSDTVDEVQVWHEGVFVGAGAWTVPYDLCTVIQIIQDVWLRRFQKG